MRLDIITLFPGICEAPLGESIIGRARQSGVVDLRIWNLRDWATDRHRVTDDMPYGGGAGMVMKPEPVFAAVEDLRESEDSRVVLLSPRGKVFTQRMAEEMARVGQLIFVCGHYEGVDERVSEHLVDAEVSIGDYVLTNGALAAAVVADAVIRLLPGALGNEESAARESFTAGGLEHPQYTRPAEFRGWRVPEVLLSGNHAAIAAWRAERAAARTRAVRPDLSGEEGR